MNLQPNIEYTITYDYLVTSVNMNSINVVFTNYAIPSPPIGSLGEPLPPNFTTQQFDIGTIDLLSNPSPINVWNHYNSNLNLNFTPNISFNNLVIYPMFSGPVNVTPFIFIDNIVIRPKLIFQNLQSPQTILCIGNSITMQPLVPTVTIVSWQWTSDQSGSTVIATTQNFQVSPSVTTIYTLADIANILPENEAEIEKYNQLSILIPVIMSIENEGKTWEELEENDRVLLTDLSENNNELPGMLAKSVRLQLESTFVYQEPIYVKVNQELKIATNPKVIKAAAISDNGSFKVSPNPAKDYIIAEYTIDKTAKEVLLVINDMQGRLQLKQKLTNTANQAIIDTRNLVNGSYHCSLMVDGQLKSTVKIIIQH